MGSGANPDRHASRQRFGCSLRAKTPKRPRDANQLAKMIVDLAHVNTSNIERSNLSMRIGNRRFTQPTNALSKNA